MFFTAVLYFRPQDHFTPLRALHLAELAAIFALTALVMNRMGRGLRPTHITAELVGVLALGGIILGTAPFSIWMGGAVGEFTDMFAKVLLIFVLMVNTLNSPKRIEQFTWMIVIASGYIGFRAVFDYARGINLIEDNRVMGAVGGMFKNPNDLALNLVSTFPLAAMLALRPLPLLNRSVAGLCGLMMLGAIVASHSRGGALGLAAMALVMAVNLVRRKPGLIFGIAFAGALMAPLLPSSYWDRVASITDSKDTGSRESRKILLQESFDAFVAHPLTGVGAGQFQNYNPEGREEAWRESHNSLLQVAAELGVFGLLTFSFLVARAIYAPIQTRRILRRLAPARRSAAPRHSLPAAEHEMLHTYAAGLSAAVAGWFVCAMFGSVAYHWTFYYLLALAAAPREYLVARLAAARVAGRATAPAPVTAIGASA
jgi:O-antigen ligase